MSQRPWENKGNHDKRIIAMREWTSGQVAKWPSEGKVRSHDRRDRDRDVSRVDPETWATEE